jgi:DNA ligase (NAD+)
MAILDNVEESQQYQDLANIDGVGEKIAKSIMQYFSFQKNIDLLQKLSEELNIIDHKIIESDSKYAGKIIVFTGTMEQMSRGEAKDKAEKLGFRVSNSVSKKTDFLVSGENSGSKLTKAKDLGIKILSESDWIEITKL